MSKPEFPFPILLADIGGTNARFSLLRAPDRPPTPPFRLKTDGSPSFAEACQKAISAQGFPAPRSLVVDGAGPVIGKTIDLTNANWLIDGDELTKTLKLDQGLTVNDFEALALGLPFFRDDELDVINKGDSGADGMRCVLGPGTGLGVGGLAATPRGFLPIGSEGGHVTIRPADKREAAIFDVMEMPMEPLSAEMFLQGAGLLRLHQARLKAEDKGDARETPASVVEAALVSDGPERRTVMLYLDVLARFAGDMAVTFLSKGGCYVGGGIIKHMLPLVDRSRFRSLFEAKPPHQPLLRKMPLKLVVSEEPAFTGLAAVATQPQKFLLDYDNRLWR
jgi:glucokinase